MDYALQRRQQCRIYQRRQSALILVPDEVGDPEKIVCTVAKVCSASFSEREHVKIYFFKPAFIAESTYV